MHHSGYFRGAFNSNKFAEGAAGEVSTMVLIPELLREGSLSLFDVTFWECLRFIFPSYEQHAN